MAYRSHVAGDGPPSHFATWPNVNQAKVIYNRDEKIHERPTLFILTLSNNADADI